MNKYRNKVHRETNTTSGKVIPMQKGSVKDLPKHKEKSQVYGNNPKKMNLNIAHEIAREVGFHGTAFGRNMRTHYKQGR